MKFLINGVDIGDQIRKYRITETEIVLELEYDFEPCKIDGTFWPLYNDYLPFRVEIDDTFSRTCILGEYQPVAGPIGDLSPAVVITLVRAPAED